MKKVILFILSLLLCTTFFLNVCMKQVLVEDVWEEISTSSEIVTNRSANYKLVDDITLNGLVNFGTADVNCTIDLNGHTLYGSSNSYMFRLGGRNTTLTITDNSENHDGKVVPVCNVNHSVLWQVGGVPTHFVLNNGIIDGSQLAGGNFYGMFDRIETADSSVTINGGTIQNFNSTGNGAVYYVFKSNATITINGGTIQNNTGKDSTVVEIDTNYGGSLIINGGTIQNNTATGSAGGVYQVRDGNSLYLYGGTITNNSAPRGGAFYVSSGNANFYIGGNPKVYGNSASVNGGGTDIMLANQSTFEATKDLDNDALLYLFSSTRTNDTVLGTLTNSNDISNVFVDSNNALGYRQENGQLLIGHKIGDYYFVAWNKADSLPTSTGNYFLTQDVTLTDVHNINNNIFIDLHGHNITQTKDNSEVMTIRNGSSLSIFDSCASEQVDNDYVAGVISGGKNSAIRLKDEVVNNKGTVFNLYDGIICDNTTASSENGGAICLEGHGTFNMYGGQLNNNYANKNGGAIYANNYSKVNLYGGALIGNRVSDSGGAFHLTGLSDCYIENVSFLNNSAYRFGGAIYADSAGTTLHIKSATFKDNESRSNSGGAIALFTHATMTIENADIIDNKAVYGGGIRIRKAYATIYNCNITGNIATVSGGAIQAEGIDIPMQTSCLTLNDGYIANNQSDKGGAIYIGGTSVVYLNKGILENNKATDGGAIYLSTLGYGIFSNLNIKNNEAIGIGGGICAPRGTRSEINNLSLVGNKAVNGGAIYINDDFKMSNINVTNNIATNGAGGIFIDSADYDGESYYSSIIKMDGNMFVYGNNGLHPNMYIKTNSIVNGTALGFGSKAKIGLQIEDEDLSKVLVGKYNSQVVGNEYIITKYFDYTITYYCDGGTINEGKIDGYNFGQEIILPSDITKDDYIFLGWYDNEEFNGEPIETIANTETGNKTYYAKWEQNHIHGDFNMGIDDNVEWIAWTRSDALPSSTIMNHNDYYNKYYYLTCDVYLTQRQNFFRTVTIDLNGHSIYKAENASFDGAMISVNGKWANPLIFTNCKATFDEDGFLTSNAGFHNSNATGAEGAVLIANGSSGEYPNVKLYGICFMNNSNVRSNNEEKIPGAIYWNGGSTLTIDSCAFINNISGNSLENDSTYGAGGAISIRNVTESNRAGTVNINNTLFDGNKAGNRGSAINIFAGAEVDLNINKSKFINNKVLNSATTVGGVIALSSGKLMISDSIFTNNENAGNNATVIYATGNANVTLEDVNIADNRNTNKYTAYKSAVSVIGNPTFTIKGKTIIANNTNSANKAANIFLRTNNNLLPKIIANNLADDAILYVNTNGTIDNEHNYILVEGKNVTKNIYSEDDNYYVKYFDNDTVLSKTPGIKSAIGSLTISDNINANVELELNENPEDYRIEYTFLNEKHIVDVNNKNVDINVEGIFAFQMADPINIDVYYENNLVDTIEYSVKKYCESQILNSTDEKLINLCKATLNYGAAAQQYFNGRAWNDGTYSIDIDNLANAISVTTEIADANKPTNTKNVVGDLGGKVTDVKFTLVVGSEVSMKFYIYTNSELDLQEVEVGCSPAKAITELYKESEGRYSIKIVGLKATELGNDYSISFSDNEGSMTLTYSPYAFAANKWDGGNNLAELCKKLVTYGDKAVDYTKD